MRHEDGYKIALERIKQAKAAGARGGAMHLDLSGLGLTAVPKELGGLQALTLLRLDNNQLTAVPKELGGLQALTLLRLDNNQLTAVPKELGELKALTLLDLSDNQLTAVPKELGELKSLKALWLNNNQLTAGGVPKELGELKQLTHLFLHDNPALGIPPEVHGPTFLEVFGQRKTPAKPAEILAYYFRLQSAKATGAARPLNEAKLLFVGEGEVGKSSLVERLLHPDRPFVKGRGKTEGIGRETWMVTCPNGTNGGPTRINVWDFGGQEVMHATHQFFLTRRSLYVIVLAGRGGEHQGRLDYWLRAVTSYGGGSPIIIVANKADEHRLEINITRIKKDYPEAKIDFFQVSCKDGEGIEGEEGLRARLMELIAGLENVNDEVPDEYFLIKDELEAAAREKNYLERAEYLGICKRHNVSGEDEQDRLLRFLHELGTVLNFHDPESPYNFRDTHILNPEWVTEGVYDVLNNNGLMKKEGVLDEADLSRILKKPERYPADKQKFILNMMRRFEIAVDIPGRPGKLLVPELLPVNEPEQIGFKEEEALNFEFGYTVLPAGIIPRYIVRSIAAAKTKWKSGVIIEYDGCKALVRGDAAKNRVRVSVVGMRTQRRSALGAIRSVFREIHATVPGFKPEERVPIPGEPEVAAVPYEHLLKLEEKRITEFIPQGSFKVHRVADLLEGVEEHRAARDRERPVMFGDRTDILY